MPKFAIMRHAKHKAGGNLNASLQHNYRERETLNADEQRTPDNEHIISNSTSEVLAKLNDRLPEKVRKNGVVAVEYLMTASPEFFKDADKQQQKEFFSKSMDWLKDKHGEENIISATIHRDESTPHLAVFVVPITKDGRLSARDFLGGRKLLSEAQTSYAKQVAHLGLERGVEKSKAQHKSIQEYYQEINDKSNQPQAPRIEPQDVVARVTKKGLVKSQLETAEQVASRLNRQIEPIFKDITEKANLRRFERERAQKDRETSINTSKRLKLAETRVKNWREMFQKDLKPEQFETLKEQAQEIRRENYRNEMKVYLEANKSEQIKYKRALSGDRKKEFLQRLEKVTKAVNAKTKSSNSQSPDFDR